MLINSKCVMDVCASCVDKKWWFDFVHIWNVHVKFFQFCACSKAQPVRMMRLRVYISIEEIKLYSISVDWIINRVYSIETKISNLSFIR